MNDTSTVKFTQDDEEKSNADDNPFADIMNKLKSEKKSEGVKRTETGVDKTSFSNLMDEEPPAFFNEPETQIQPRSPSVIVKKEAEASPFIKAAFEITAKPETVANIVKDSVVTDISNEIAYSETVADIAEARNIHDTILNQQIKALCSASISPQFDAINEDIPVTPVASDILVVPVAHPVIPEVQDIQDVSAVCEIQPFSVPSTLQVPSVVPVSSTLHVSSAVPEIQSAPEIPIVSANSDNSSVSSIAFLDSFPSLSSSNSDTSSVSSPNSFSTSPRTTGFRASILKHGLSALEKIGKSTADVVVSTRNKLSEPSNSNMAQSQSHSQMITPDYADQNSTFHDILKLYGGYAKLQV